MKTLSRAALAAATLAAVCVHATAGGAPGKGDKLVDVSLVTLDGKTTSLSKLVKGRVTALKFGATWCGWCTRLLKEFDKAAGIYGDKVLFLDIDVGEPAATVKAHHERQGSKALTVLDPERKAAARYGVRGFPTLIITDHEARILLRVPGYIPFERFKPILDQAVRSAQEGSKGKGKPAAREKPKLIDAPLVTLGGQKTTLAQVTKGRVVLFKFGATWCPPCTAQLGEFNKVLDAYGDQVLVLDIDIREPASAVKAHHGKHGFKAQALLDPTAEAAKAYNVQSIPLNVILDRQGRILHKGGFLPFKKLKAILDPAVKEKPAEGKPAATPAPKTI